ncbi:MAG: DMT family transporter [Deltaproteobacteria bacterium]|nr:DMT family transporter [Deltaproteobacteria bacterium]MBW2307503.1 DMT family transporter [Deltaproteobacteria bacterium]
MPPLPQSRCDFGKVKGPAALFSAAGFFAFFDTMLKYLSLRVPSGEIVLVRFLLGLIISVPALIRYSRHLDGRSVVLLITRGFLGALAIFSLINALRLGTLSGSMVLFFTNPIWTLVLSVILLGEQLTRQRVIGVMISFLGAVLVIGPRYGEMAPGDLLGLAAGVFAGAAMVVIRHLRARCDTFVIYGFHSLIGVAISIPLVARNPVAPEVRLVGILLVVSVLGLLGQLTMTYGLGFVRPAEAAVILMTESLLTILMGALLFHETLTPLFLVGAAMILGSSVFLARTGI